MAWWANSNGTKNIKRKNRFIVRMGNGGILLALKSATKPKATTSKKEYRMINHYYNYPGVVKWEPITMTFVDVGFWGADEDNHPKEDYGTIPAPKSRGTAETFWEMLLGSGYTTPNAGSPKSGRSGRNKSISSPEKAATMDISFGKSLFIEQIDDKGNTIEKWELFNPIFTTMSWGDLDYGDDGLVEYSLEVTYDWAELSLSNKDDSTSPTI